MAGLLDERYHGRRLAFLFPENAATESPLMDKIEGELKKTQGSGQGHTKNLSARNETLRRRPLSPVKTSPTP